MDYIKNPRWIDSRLLSVGRLEDFPESIFYEINKNLGVIQGENPLVSVVIPVYNEEVNIVRTLYYLSKNKTRYSVEIIVVNNNSTDRTQEVLNRFNVKSVFQIRQGCGPARQLGQETARGKYILMGDGDCIYPSGWIEKMTNALMAEDVTCVYGRYSFLGSPDRPRWKFFLYESMRDVMANFRHIKRPCLNALGMSMGYVKDIGLKTRFVDKKIRGEDGRLCLHLQQFGNIKQVRDRSIRVWTLPRTLEKENNLLYSLMARIAVELSRIKDYFTKQDPREIANGNYSPPVLKHFKKYREVHKQKEVAE